MEKNKTWLWRAIDGVSREPLGWKLGDRCHTTAKTLIETVDTGSCDFVTDQWGGFFKLPPEDRHFYGKDLTFPIEATNSDLRHRLPRFTRKTKASSRSFHMVESSVALFHHLQQKGDFDALLCPLLSFFS